MQDPGRVAPGDRLWLPQPLGLALKRVAIVAEALEQFTRLRRADTVARGEALQLVPLDSRRRGAMGFSDTRGVVGHVRSYRLMRRNESAAGRFRGRADGCGQGAMTTS